MINSRMLDLLLKDYTLIIWREKEGWGEWGERKGDDTYKTISWEKNNK